MELILVFLILMQGIHYVMPIVGFDCSGNRPNITTLSLLDIGECNYQPTKINSTSIDIQLLQIAEYSNTHVIQCKVEISRTIYYCGMHSHVSVVHNGRADYLLDISPHRCQILHEEGTLSLGNGVILANVPVNATITRSATLAGSLTDDGSCEGTQYSDNYGTWKNVVVQASIKITLKDVFVPVRLGENKLILRSGTVCRFSEGNCIDIDDGMTFWKPTPSERRNFNNYDVLYDGLATKITDTDPNHPIIYTLKSKEVVFALTMVAETQICGYRFIRTEHPRLFILEGTLKIPTKPIQVENIDMFTYVNSKFVYVERHIRTQISSLYEDILKHRCNLERKVLSNSISFATQSPDEFAFNIMQSPGYMAVAAGEVVHLIKCVPVEVTVRQTNVCYNELPIIHGNNTYFLTPKSRIVVKRGTVKECSKILPTMYYLNDRWVKFMPAPVESLPPQQMRPQNAPTWRYESPGELATSGIYSNEDIENLRDHIMFAKEQPAVLNSIARGITGNNPQDQEEGILYNLLDEKSLNKIAESATNRLWQGLLTFGSVSSAFIAIYVLYQFITMIINAIAHGYALHDTYGCTAHLVASLCEGVTNLLLNKQRTKTVNNLQSISPPKPERATTKNTTDNQIQTESPSLVIQQPTYVNTELYSRIKDNARRLERLGRDLQEGPSSDV